MDNRETVFELLENGKRKAQIEKKVLEVMFNGYSNLKFQAGNVNGDIVTMLSISCGLPDYLKSVNEEDYDELGKYDKSLYLVLLVLDALTKRGLVERKYLFTDEFSPEEGPQNLTRLVEKSYHLSTRWFVEKLNLAECRERKHDFNETDHDEMPRIFWFESIEFQLSTKGYDVALTFLEHELSQRRNDQQFEISKKAASASTSAARTAKYALIVGVCIATGALGNLLLGLLNL